MPFRQKLIVLTIALALFMEALDTTIINTAIPAMSLSLHVNPINLKIALISYLLTLAVFIPISGWIADKYGIKKVFIISIGIFTLSSLWCGFAHNLFDLVIARGVQGIGGALGVPLGRLILFRMFERHKLVDIMSHVVMVAALGLMLGPVLGGIITHNLSWPWIFWVNVPVGIFTMLMAGWLLIAMPVEPVAPLDKLGFVLFGASLAGLTFSLSALSESALNFSTVVEVGVVSVLLLVAYVWHSANHPHPIVDPELFKFRSFQVSTVGNLISRIGFGGLPFLLPIVLQISLGYSSQEAGLLMAPLALGILIVKPFSFRLLHDFGYKKMLIVNTALVTFSIWSFMFVNASTPVYLIIIFTFFFGFLLTLQFSAMNSLAYAEISSTQLSGATSVMGTLQQMSQSFGVAIGALLIHFFSKGSSSDFSLTLIVFHRAFFVMGLVTLASMLIFIRLRPEDGRQMLEGTSYFEKRG